MSDVEHYIENAITLIEQGKRFEHFCNNNLIKEGKELTGISFKDMWEIASYVIYTYKRYINK